MNATESALLDRIWNMPILDTHEHLPLRPALRETPCDVLTEYLSHYFDKDLISAGMPRPLLDQALDPSLDIEERFARIEPWWDLCRLTGYGRALEHFDRTLGEALRRLRPGDLLAVTGDHGCDPTFRGTDHTREYVPLLLHGGATGDLGVRTSFSDLAATVCRHLGVAWASGEAIE